MSSVNWNELGRVVTVGLVCVTSVLGQLGCGAGEVEQLAVESPEAGSVQQGVASNLSDFFIIGVDFQPSSTFATWKARGINTVVRWRSGAESMGAFDNAAVANGLKAIRVSTNPAADATLPHLIATLDADEPEMKHANYVEGRAAVQAANDADNAAGKPFFTNFAGPWIRNDVNGTAPNDYCGIRGQTYNQWCYGEYMLATDWVAFDDYPMNAGIDVNSIANIMRLISPLVTTKPRIAYVEASDYNCTGGYPNEWTVTYQAALAVISGARGIIYFPHKLGGTEGHCATPAPDGTTAPIQTEMTRLNTALAAVPATTLNGTVNPSGVTFESGETTGQIRWGTRKDATHAYYLTENDSGSTTYSHVVRFWGISNCANKVLTVWEAGLTGTRTVTLNASCVTTTLETWAPRRWRLYRAAVN